VEADRHANRRPDRRHRLSGSVLGGENDDVTEIALGT
jgi:hypothetical protein